MIYILTLYIPLKKVGIKLAKHEIQPFYLFLWLTLLLTIFGFAPIGHYLCLLTVQLVLLSFPILAIGQGPNNRSY